MPKFDALVTSPKIHQALHRTHRTLRLVADPQPNAECVSGDIAALTQGHEPHGIN